jgi:acetyltransferase-like isoleucine patch superfamily enzyme
MSTPSADPEIRECLFCARFIHRIYARVGRENLRAPLRRFVLRREGGPAVSPTIRRIFRDYHEVDVGFYTAGPCASKPQVFHAGTTIGRYTLVADTVRTFTRNHPMNTKSTHGLFYNPALGLVDLPPLKFGSLNIGHGVTLGHNVIILPPTSQIGTGAIIAPGTVVYANVPPYALVSGFPSRVTGYRYDKQAIADLLESKWWEKSPAELAANADSFRGIWNRPPAPPSPQASPSSPGPTPTPSNRP